jgi:hypothetical protein
MQNHTDTKTLSSLKPKGSAATEWNFWDWLTGGGKRV